ncbi:hypothetical protein F5B19DRAFT_18084 [Rostrohypoxylon terebratum]|nr:hypothetical protein F5B19DRAFT_18084 [Rostrohypoxylon terebratum]
MAPLSYNKHNGHLSGSCLIPSFPSDLSNQTNLLPPKSHRSVASVCTDQQLPESSQPNRRYTKSKSQENTVTSQILGRIFKTHRSCLSRNSSSSHLQIRKRSRKLLSAIRPIKIDSARPTAALRMKRKESTPPSAACFRLDMPSKHSIIACRAITSRPTTVVAASYDVDSQLRVDVISGNKTNVDFPDEGVFVIYRNRALQIAAPPCDQRKCNISQICRCHSPQLAAQGALHDNSSAKGAVRWPMRKPCSHCLFNWLHLYQATDAASQLHMKCLQHPRSLTLTTLHGEEAFYYDSEIEDEHIHSKNNGNSSKYAGVKSSCSSTVFEWMTDAWTEFTDCCCWCKTTSITALSDSECGAPDEESSSNGQGNSDDDWDWDDFDTPCKQKSQSSDSESEDYDFIEDLVDTEFPKLRKSNETLIAAGLQAKAKLSRHPAINNDDDSTAEDDIPAPVVIPPKNMAVGQGLRRSLELQSPTPVPTRNSSLVTVIDAQYAKSQGSLGTKRSYCDLVDSEGSDTESAEDLSRAKQRKLDLASPDYAVQYPQRYITYGSFPQTRFLRKLVHV